MNIFLKNFIYILQHKYYVFCECWKIGLYLEAFFHDISKFSIHEFVPYSYYFFSTSDVKKEKYKETFQYSWLHHQHHNPHHWNYWVVNQYTQEVLPMPEKYIKEMICDWKAMSRKFHDDPYEYFLKNKDHMILHPSTIQYIEQYFSNNKGEICHKVLS